MRVAIVALLCFAAVVAADNLSLTNDNKCKGTCINTKTAKGGCSGGTFVRGLCSGAKEIQCCVIDAKARPQPAQNGVGVSCGAGGVCQLSSSSCAGEWVSGKCPGADNVKCCQPKAVTVVPTPRPPTTTPPTPVAPAVQFGVGKPCGVKGVCQLDSTACAGDLLSGKCPGKSNVKCCQPKAAAAPVTPAPVTPTPTPAVQEGVGKPCGVQGVCQLDSTACAGDLLSGKCPGKSNVKCCQPKGAAPVAAAPGWASFGKLWQSYPHGEAADVKRRIGGGINADYITNTCVVRVTRAMVQAGMTIAPFKLRNGKNMLTVKGADGKALALRVAEFNEYIRAKYGKPSVSVTNAGDGSASVPQQFMGKKGVIMFDVRVWNDATGHFDIWDGSACAHNCYFDKARQVFLWEIL